MDTRSYIEYLQTANALRASTLKAGIGVLQLPQGSRGLDVGCGIGLPCLLLAEAAGANGHVTGLDVVPEFLDRGREIAAQAGLSGRIDFEEGDMSHIPFADNTFDWAWSADCVGYGPGEPVPLLREMGRVVKPGGIVAISAWSSENLLPGYPRLEARLKATPDGMAPFVHGKNPGTHFLRALGWFREAGLAQPEADTFAHGVHAPLDPAIREALVDLFNMRWPDAGGALSSQDLLEYHRLCLPDSPEFILDLPDYYAFFTYTLFQGRACG